MTNSREIHRQHFNLNAEALLEVIEDLVKMTPEQDASIIEVKMSPHFDFKGDSGGNHAQLVILVEETLTDGSMVYNIEIY